MAKKFTLAIAPTFKAKVKIPVPGAGTADVEFTYRHKTRDEFKAFLDALSDREDSDVIQEIACGWALEDAFDEENLNTLMQNYPGAARAIANTYVSEMAAARLGN